MEKKIYYNPYQPDYCRQSNYRSYTIDEDNLLYGIVYEIYEFSNEGVSSDLRLKALPDGVLDMIIIFRDNDVDMWVGGGDGKLYDVCYQNVTRIIGMGLVPGVIKSILPCNAEDVSTSGRVFLSGLQQFIRMKKDLLFAETFEERMELVQNLIFSLMFEQSGSSAVIRQSVNQIARHLEEFRVEEIASEAGYSLRYYRKLFLENVGYSPKKYMRIVRFQESYKALLRTPDASLTDISVEYGYYDLPHMNKEYQLLTGNLPCELKQIFA